MFSSFLSVDWLIDCSFVRVSESMIDVIDWLIDRCAQKRLNFSALSILGLKVDSWPSSPLKHLRLTKSTGSHQSDYELLNGIVHKVLRPNKGVFEIVKKRLFFQVFKSEAVKDPVWRCWQVFTSGKTIFLTAKYSPDEPRMPQPRFTFSQ